MSENHEGQQQSQPEKNRPSGNLDAARDDESLASLPADSQANLAASETEDVIADSVQEHGEDATAAEEDDVVTAQSTDASASPGKPGALTGTAPGTPALSATVQRGRIQTLAEEAGESSDAIQDSGQSGRDRAAIHAGEGDAPRS